MTGSEQFRVLTEMSGERTSGAQETRVKLVDRDAVDWRQEYPRCQVKLLVVVMENRLSALVTASLQPHVADKPHL
uniref:Uncharacterized protein n=1 Tax=Ditylenchus dipsaci TaxID=166011 RepID=A0A915DIB4_9BILA